MLKLQYDDISCCILYASYIMLISRLEILIQITYWIYKFKKIIFFRDFTKFSIIMYVFNGYSIFCIVFIFRWWHQRVFTDRRIRPNGHQVIFSHSQIAVQYGRGIAFPHQLQMSVVIGPWNYNKVLRTD